MSRGGARRRLVLAAALPLLVGLAACGRDRAPQEAPPGPPDATYTVRGVVWQLPTAGGPRELVVFHEAIPEFVDRKGERSGMDSMTMPFGVAPDVPLDGVAEGDKVELTFELRWADPQPLRVVRLTELPGDAPVSVGARPAGDDPPPSASPAVADDDAGADHAHH